MSNKVVKLSEEERQKQENETYMRGRPNRMEMSNYVNNLMEQHYMPEFMRLAQQSQSAMQMGLMILQSILIKKGICTGEEIEEITKEFVEKFKQEAQKETEDKNDVK